MLLYHLFALTITLSIIHFSIVWFWPKSHKINKLKRLVLKNNTAVDPLHHLHHLQHYRVLTETEVDIACTAYNGLMIAVFLSVETYSTWPGSAFNSLVVASDLFGNSSIWIDLKQDKVAYGDYEQLHQDCLPTSRTLSELGISGDLLRSICIFNKLNRKKTIILSRCRFCKKSVSLSLIIKLLLLMAGIESNPGPDNIICYCKKARGKGDVVTCSVCNESFHYNCVNFKCENNPSNYNCHVCLSKKEGFDQHNYFRTLFLNLQNIILDFTLNVTDTLSKLDAKLDYIGTKVDCANTIQDFDGNIGRSQNNNAEKSVKLDDILYGDINDSDKWEIPKKYGYINGKKEFDIPIQNRFDPLISFACDSHDIPYDCNTNNHTNHKCNNPTYKAPLNKNKNRNNVRKIKQTKVKILGDSVLRNVGNNIEDRCNLKISSTILSGGGVFNMHNLGFKLSETDKICVFSLGGNDLKNHSIKSILNELFSALNYFISTYPDKMFVFGSILPRSDINSKTIQMFNHEVRKFSRLNGILFIDSFNSFNKAHYCNDGIHLNGKGLNKLGLLYSNFLSRIFLIRELC